MLGRLGMPSDRQPISASSLQTCTNAREYLVLTPTLNVQTLFVSRGNCQAIIFELVSTSRGFLDGATTQPNSAAGVTSCLLLLTDVMLLVCQTIRDIDHPYHGVVVSLHHH